MKIVKVELENINALKGKWTIDFTDENYKINHNQFVICGDTGAGKTTILDAIALALYGKTPREDISKSKNEIMCKGQACCMAAVTYECSRGTFRSRFYQRRARMNPAGALQEPECSITNVDSGEVIDKVKSVRSLADATTRIIDLDYHQFCRSILLAQGSFDQFLKGSEREKADILAKLNGMEHYKAVGAKLREKADQVIKECDRQLEKINAIQVLSEEELSEKHREMKVLGADLKRIKKEEEEIQKKMQWREAFDESERAFLRVKREAEAFKQQKEEFEAEKQGVLDAANKAMECEGQYVEYSGAAKSCQSLSLELEKAKKEQKTAEERKAFAELTRKSSKEKYDIWKAEEEEKKELWKQVRLMVQECSALHADAAKQKKRKDDTSQAFRAANSNVKAWKESVKGNEEQLAKIDGYLSEHEKDERLAEQLSGMDVKKDSIEAAIRSVQQKQREYNRLDKELQEKKKVFMDKQQKIAEMEQELQAFISSNYMSISKVLRGVSLEEGKPCPVCGAIEHPFVTAEAVQEDVAVDEKQGVVAIAVKLSEDLEAKQKEEAEYSQMLSKLEMTCQTSVRDIQAEKDNVRKLIEEFQAQIKDWKLQIDKENIIASMEQILDTLKNLRDQYKEYHTQKDMLLQENAKYNAQLGAIDLEDLKTKANQEIEEYNKLVRAFNEKAAAKRQLFGDKKVDEEETAYYKELDTRKAQYDRDEKAFYEAENGLTAAVTKYNSTNDALADSKKKLTMAMAVLERAILEKGFGSIRAFEEAKLPEQQRNTLNREKTELERKELELKTRLEEAQGKYQEQKEQALTEASLDELRMQKRLKADEQGYKNQRIGEIKKELETNEKNEAQRAQLRGKYEESLEKRDIYKTISDSIGKKDGSDFEVFVQKLAMENLLSSANAYISQILPDYTLVQKEGSMEILLHDINHPDAKNDRPISNMSGGETFAISLALALGIAEIASYKIHVDSLFLDEGFGTLSGEPLEEAIIALKRLQSTGKMLGIITHVEPVINAFDQKITAKKAHGFSTLEGNGISRTIEDA